MKILFSTVIVNYNGGEKIIKSITSVMNQDFSNHEIIVVDNGSTDGSLEKIKKISCSKLKIFPQPENYGFTKGSNIGIKKAQGKYTLLLNNDAYLADKNFIKNIYSAFNKSDKNIACIVPKVLFNWEKSIINSSYVEWHSKFMWYDKYNGTVDPHILGIKESQKNVFGAMFVAPVFNTKIFKKIGLFDETFFTYAEDFDVSYRINILGYKFLYLPEIKVYHDFRSSSNEDRNPLWSYFFFLRNYLMVILKNYEFINLVLKFPNYTSFIRNDLKRSLKNKDWPLFKLIFRVLYSLLTKTPDILKNRKFVQKRRKVSDKDIWSNDFAFNFNPFFYNSKIVLNMSNLEQTLNQK